MSLVLAFLLLAGYVQAQKSSTQSGSWNNTATWGGTAPGAGDDVIIAAGTTVTIDAAAVVNNLTINNAGTLTVSGTNTLTVNGSWTNNGIFTANNSTVVLAGSTDVSFSGNSPSAFYNLTVSKTNGLEDVIDFTSAGTVSCSHDLILTSGLLKLTSGTVNLNCGNFNISEPAGIWVDGATLNTTDLTITNEGLIRVSSGIANFGTESGNSVHTQINGAFEVTGGNVFIAGRLENTAGGTVASGIPSGLNISGGTITIGTVGNGLSSAGTLDVSTHGAFNFTGGTIVFQYSSTAATPLDVALVLGSGSGVKNTVGGTFQFGNGLTPAGTLFRIDSEIPIDNLALTTNASALVVGHDLTISNVLTMNGGDIDAATNSKKVILTDPDINSISRTSGAIIGSMERAIGNTGGTAYLFPVGNGADYTPLLLNFTGANTGGTISVASVATDPALSGSVLNPGTQVHNNWSMVNSGVTFSSLGGEFNFPDGIADNGTYKLGVYNGSSWSYPTVTSSTLTSVSFSGITSQSGTLTFALAECTPPAITLGTSPTVCRGATSASLTYSSTTGTPTEYRIDYGPTANTAGLLDVPNTSLSASPILLAVPSGIAPGTYNATLYVSNAADCEGTGVGFTVTVTPDNTIILSSAAGTDNQTRCVNTPITNITYTTTGATGATFSGLPAGVSGTWGANTVTISGTPTISGTFSYTITLTGGCGNVTKTGIIQITPDNTIILSSAAGTDNQTRCVNTPITNITYTATGATGATFSGLPAGVSGTWAANTVTISGTPTISGTFSYTITLTGGCGNVTKTGSVTVNPNHTITRTSGVATTNQLICNNKVLTNISYTLGGGATGAEVTGLPAGVTGTLSGTTYTISGTPTVSGTFDYTVTTTGNTCVAAITTGRITVLPTPTVLTALPDQNYCHGDGIPMMALTGSPSGVVFDISGGASIGLADKTGVNQIPAYTALSGSALVTITPRANGCSGTPVTFRVTVNPKPGISLSSDNNGWTICSGGSTNVSISSTTPGATFRWVVSSIVGTITGATDGEGSLLNQTLYNNTAATGTVTYQVTASFGGCEGAKSSLTIYVNPAVSATIAGPTTVCQGDVVPITFTANGGAAPYTFTYNINGGTNQQVTTTAGNAAIVNVPTGVAGTFNYNLVNVSGSTNCTYPQTGTAVVTVKPKPVLTSTLRPPGICSNTTFNYTHESSLTGTGFYWVREEVAGISNPREEGNSFPNETLVNVTTSPIEVTYYYTLTADGCSNTQEVKVMVTQTPTLTSTFTPNQICSGTTFSYNPTSSINPGTTFNWIRYADSNGNNTTKSGTGNPNEVLFNTTNNPVTVTYHYSLSSNSCANPTDFRVNVTVIPAPVVTASASKAAICPGETVNLFSSSNIASGLPTSILTENFNGTASNWIRNNAGNGTWTLRTSLGINGGNQISNGGSQFYVSDMRNADASSTLRSPSINTQGYTSVTLTFSHYYRDANGSRARVRWSSDGINWTTLQPFDNSNFGQPTNFALATVNIPVGEPVVYLQFRHDGDNDYYWAIDNVAITGVPQSTANILWTSNTSSWTSTQKNPTNVSPTQTTIYTVTYSDPTTGCSGSASTEVTVFPTPDATISADYCVAAPKIRLTTGSFASYNWSPLPLGETNGKQYIDIDIAGVYTVNVTDANGCKGTASINVSNEYVTNGSFSNGNTGFTTDYLPRNDLSTGNRTIGGINYTGGEGYFAVGSDARAYHSNFWGWDHTAHDGNPPNNFLIVNGVGNTLKVWEQVVTVAPNTDYYFSAWAINLNADGTDNTYWARLQFFVNGNPVGSIAQLGRGVTGSSQNNPWLPQDRFYGIWNSGNNTSATITIRQLNTNASGNDFGIDDISFGVLSPSPARIAPSGGGEVCTGETIQLFANTTGGKEPIVYRWEGPNGYLSTDKNPVITNATSAHSGTYTLTVDDWYGCNIDPEVINVNVYSAPVVSAGPDQSYGCSATSSFPLNGSIGGSATSSTWTTSGTGTFNDASSPTAIYTISEADVAAGGVTLTLTTNDPLGPCAAVSDNMRITISRSPEISVDIVAPRCSGYNDGAATASVTNGTPPYTYLWSNGQTTAKITGLVPGSYSLRVTDANGCIDTEIVNVVEPTALVVYAASFTPPSCYGGSDGTATIVAEGGTKPYVYQWDAAAKNQTTQVATGLKIGIYSYTVTDANGCNITSDFVLVTQPDPPTITCPEDILVEADAGLCSAIVSIIPATATGNGVTITGVRSDGKPLTDPYPIGATTITWTATDPCGNSPACTQTVTITDNQPPTFILPPAMSECVTTLTSAVFNPATIDINPVRPEYFIFVKGNTALNVTNLADNCCDVRDLTIHWRIDFSTGGSISGTGQPSTYNNDIYFPGDQPPYDDDLVHTITYWIKDCKGKEWDEQFQYITIKPRPNIIKMN